ncbi:MAG: hypothetical protein C4326_07185 [Ignavibacteria bacterium]
MAWEIASRRDTLSAQWQVIPDRRSLSRIRRHLKESCKLFDHTLPEDEQIDFIKIDVEGFEYNVLKGGLNLVRGFHPVIVFEANRVALQRYQQTLGSVLVLLRGLGYKLLILEKGKWSRYNPIEFDGIHNVIAVHRKDHPG